MKALPHELQVARYALSRSHPYISSVLLNLNFIEKEGIGTLGVDKYWRCYYDPTVVTVWPTKQLEGVLFHEVNHLLRSHPERGEHFPEHDKMNIAADMEINPDIIQAGLELPQGVVFPKHIHQPDGLLAEEYYHKIPTQTIKVSGVGAGKCGSCAGGEAQGFEDEAPKPGEGMSHAEQELVKRMVAKDIEGMGKDAGSVPDGLKRWADATLHPQVKWTKELASVVRRAMIEVLGKQDRTYKRMSRIAGALDSRIVLPGWKAYAPNVALVQDTSGSMGESDLSKSLAETKGVLQALGSTGHTVTYISVDCSVGAKKKISNMRQAVMVGGGGTDMGIGIAEAEKTKPRVDICIVLTDGYTPWPSVPPPFKTIVVLTQSGAEKQVPSWAKYIVVN